MASTRSAASASRANSRTDKPARILVGVRLEERLVKVMKGLAALNDFTLGELVEEVFLRAMEGESAFADRKGRLSPEMKRAISGLRAVYGVNYNSGALLPGRK
jgi:hypothetical protein